MYKEEITWQKQLSLKLLESSMQPNVPFKIRKMLSEYTAMSIKHKVAFPYYNMSEKEFESMVRTKCSQALATGITELIERTVGITTTNTPEGIEYSMSGYFFTYEQMLALLNIAYTEGMKEFK